MKKILLSVSLLFMCVVSFSQTLFQSKNGEISFFSETPLENIDAVNNTVKAVINLTTNEFAFVTSIIGFHFDSPLMEEHFNENYMESNKYKTSHFKGKIMENVDYKTDGEYKVKAKGVLNIHGVDRETEIPATITVKNGVFSVKSQFNVKLEDFKIKIPKIVSQKISEEVKVSVNMNFEPKII